MGGDWHELRDFYENEAALRLRKPRQGRRVELRERFVHLLEQEGRSSVIDFGAGPGGDGEAFCRAGCRYLGVDLANGNARLAANVGVTVVQGSITAVPVRSGSFHAGWSLSTLMHLDADEAGKAIGEMVRVLRPNAPLVIGVWGSEAEQLVMDDRVIPGFTRPFNLRSFATNRALVASWLAIVQADRWEQAADGWDYHVFWGRATNAGDVRN